MLSVQLPEFLSAVTNISGCSSQQYRIHRRVDEQFTKARWRGAESACQEECGQNHSSWSEPHLIGPQPLFATSILRCRAQFLHIANVSSSGSELRRNELRRNVRPAHRFIAVIRGTYSCGTALRTDCRCISEATSSSRSIVRLWPRLQLFCRLRC